MDSTKEHKNRELQCISLCSALYPAPIWSNLKTFDALPFREKVDIITGGYPCQGESVAGTRKGKSHKGWLWDYISTIVKTVKPLWCFFENVEGHLSLGYSEVYRSLSDMGYKVEAGIFSSSETGGTHQRKRLFILAKLANTNINDECNNSREIRKEKAETKGETQREERGNLFGQRSRAKSSTASSESELGNSNNTRSRVKLQDSKRSENYEGREGFAQFKSSETDKAEANNNSQGLQQKDSSRRWEKQNGSTTQFSRIPIYPPSPYQYEWEEPRQNTKDALKSRMGLSTTDGYDYRTDLLRSLGNGVDPFTAAKAWITLIKKFK